jgi:histidinol dehydrogenase
MKRNSVGQVSQKGYAQIAKHSHRMAVFEGFDGHALAVSEWREKFLQDA